QEIHRVDRFAQALSLPGDLIDGDVWSGVAPLARGRRGARLGRRLLEQRESVVIGAETHEPATPRKLVRHPEPEQVRVEVVGLLDVGHVEAKVPEAANLERAIEQDARSEERRGGKERKSRR